LFVFSVKIQVEGDFGAAMREAWERRNEIDGGIEAVFISPETMEVDENAESTNQQRQSVVPRNRSGLNRRKSG
jgi:hypothetical protein